MRLKVLSLTVMALPSLVMRRQEQEQLPLVLMLKQVDQTLLPLVMLLLQAMRRLLLLVQIQRPLMLVLPH